MCHEDLYTHSYPPIPLKSVAQLCQWHQTRMQCRPLKRLNFNLKNFLLLLLMLKRPSRRRNGSRWCGHTVHGIIKTHRNLLLISTIILEKRVLAKKSSLHGVTKMKKKARIHHTMLIYYLKCKWAVNQSKQNKIFKENNKFTSRSEFV